MNNIKKAYFYALTAIFFWSTVGVAFKLALQYVDYIQLLFFSVLVALFCFLLISVFEGKFRDLIKTNRKELAYSAFVGFLNPFLYYIILLKAYSLLPAQLAQPLNYLWPAMLILLSVPLLGQKLKLKSVISVILGLLGVYVISTRGDLFDYQIEEPIGVVMAAGSSVIWALFWIMNQKDKRKEQKKLFWAFAFGLLYVLIFTICFSEIQLPELNGVITLIYVGLFEMGITFFIWLKALHLTDRNDRISNLVFLSPFLALFFINMILGEDIYRTTVFGLILIVSGIFIQHYKRKT